MPNPAPWLISKTAFRRHLERYEASIRHKGLEEAAAIILRRAKQVAGVRGPVKPHLESVAVEVLKRSKE